MSRPKLEIREMKNDYQELVNYINKGYLIVCQFTDGGFYYLQSKNVLTPIKVIVYNPESKEGQNYELLREGLKDFYDNLLNNIIGTKFFYLENYERELVENINPIAEVLMAWKLKGSYGDYKMKDIK
jgi:hypothetical protein